MFSICKLQDLSNFTSQESDKEEIFSISEMKEITKDGSVIQDEVSRSNIKYATIALDIPVSETSRKKSIPATLERQTSHTMKLYEEGVFQEETTNNKHPHVAKRESKEKSDYNADHGYQSGSGRSSISPNLPLGKI